LSDVNATTTEERRADSERAHGTPRAADPEQTMWRLFNRLSRSVLLPGLAMPVVWGTTLAWWQNGGINLMVMVLALLFSLALGSSLSLLDYVADFYRAKQTDGANGGPAWSSTPDEESVTKSLPLWMDGYECIRQGRISVGAVRSIGYILLSMGMLSNLLLGLLVDWPVWVFGLMSLGLFSLYLQPFTRYRAYWWIVGDIGLLLSLGILPGFIAFYGQSQILNRTAMISMLTPAVLAWLSLHAYHLYSQHRDWKLRRRTAVVAFGAQRALDLATAVGILGFTAPLILVAQNLLPAWTLISLGALPTFLRAFARGHQHNIDRQDALQAVNLSALATVLAGLLMMSALWISV
jgi:1,4-dihydroxy-2-naphthoate octaprenyltransferase